MESNTVVLTDVFKFEQTSVTTEGKVLGDLKLTGVRPPFSQRLKAAGFKLGTEIFGANMADILGRGHRR